MAAMHFIITFNKTWKQEVNILGECINQILHSWSTLGNPGFPGHFCSIIYRCVHNGYQQPVIRKQDLAEARLGSYSTTRGPVTNGFGAFIPVLQRLLVKCQETWFLVQILLLTHCITLGKPVDLSASTFFYPCLSWDKWANLPGPLFPLL